MKSNGIVIGSPCRKCGKPIRSDYDGICMDCADLLGVSEMYGKTTLQDIAKGRGEKARQAREIIRLNKEADRRRVTVTVIKIKK